MVGIVSTSCKGRGTLKENTGKDQLLKRIEVTKLKVVVPDQNGQELKGYSSSYVVQEKT